MGDAAIPTRKPRVSSARAAASAQAAASVTPSGAGEVDGVEIARRAKDVFRYELARILTTRRFELLPPVGEGAPVTKAQGRDHGEDTSAEGLTDLVSSISHMGVLQPILVEENINEDGVVTRVVVAGERRLRAVRQGHLDPRESSNPHFKHIPAVIVQGPVGEAEVRSWQLIENLARDDLRPGELAAALLFERCAILTAKLSAARMQAVNSGDDKLAARLHIPDEVSRIDDPVQRFEALEKIRGTLTSAAAPWNEVLTQLGMNLSERKARQLVAAFKALPRHISDEMDASKVALHTRAAFVELRRGREEAADEIWAALNQRTTTIPADTIPPGCHEIIAHTDRGPLVMPVTAGQDITIPHAGPASDLHLQGKLHSEEGDTETLVDIDTTRVKVSSRTKLLHAATQVALANGDITADECVQRADELDQHAQLARHGKTVINSSIDSDSDESHHLNDDTAPSDQKTQAAESITPTLTHLRNLIKEITDGAAVSRYDKGSLQLLCKQLLAKLGDLP